MLDFSGKKVGEIRPLLYEFSGVISMLIWNISRLNLLRSGGFVFDDSGLPFIRFEWQEILLCQLRKNAVI